MQRAFSWLLPSILLAGLVLLGGGCDSSLDPLNREKGTFSVYGALDVYSEVNYIRVKNLNAPFIAESTRTLNATVTLTDVDRGVTETLQDSVVRYQGIYTHNFRTTMDIRPNTQYRVRVRPDRGAGAVRATTTTPRIAEVSAAPTGMDCETPITVTFTNVQSPENLEVRVGFRYSGELKRATVGVFAGETADQARITFTPLFVINRPRGACSPPDDQPPPLWCHELDTNKLYIQYTHFGPQSTRTVTDSVRIPGGIGSFRSYYEDQVLVPIRPRSARPAPVASSTSSIPVPDS